MNVRGVLVIRGITAIGRRIGACRIRAPLMTTLPVHVGTILSGIRQSAEHCGIRVKSFKYRVELEQFNRLLFADSDIFVKLRLRCGCFLALLEGIGRLQSILFCQERQRFVLKRAVGIVFRNIFLSIHS